LHEAVRKAVLPVRYRGASSSSVLISAFMPAAMEVRMKACDTPSLMWGKSGSEPNCGGSTIHTARDFIQPFSQEWIETFVEIGLNIGNADSCRTRATLTHILLTIIRHQSKLRRFPNLQLFFEYHSFPTTPAAITLPFTIVQSIHWPFPKLYILQLKPSKYVLNNLPSNNR